MGGNKVEKAPGDELFHNCPVMISMTGVGTRMSGLLIDVAGGSLIILLVLTAVTSIIMGMGLPTVVCYIVLATLVAPTIVKLGVTPLLAHLFVFYFGIISLITPPVALAVYAASAIAGTNPNRTGWVAVRLGLPSLLVPFFFIYSPELALQGTLSDAVRPIITASLGVVAYAAASQGYALTPLGRVERILLLIAGFCLIDPTLATDLVGGSILLAVFGRQWAVRRGGWNVPGK